MALTLPRSAGAWEDMDVLERRLDLRVRGGELEGVLLFRREEATDLTTVKEVRGRSWRARRR